VVDHSGHEDRGEGQRRPEKLVRV